MKGLSTISVLLANIALVTFGQTGCPSYTDYSSVPHGPLSVGKNMIPFMRPPLRCRTFSNPTIEQVVKNVTSIIRDPDWRQLFTNTFTNTLDTTVAWHDPSVAEPYTFLITGDITAQWIRDSTNQITPYIPYTSLDPAIANLVLGLVNMQAEELLGYPYGNAFQPPARSGLAPNENSIGLDILVRPPYNNNTVYEAKFEIDSFASFFQLSKMYWQATGDTKFLHTKSWKPAVVEILAAIKKLQQPTYSATSHRLNRPLVEYTRLTWSSTETQFGGGMGNPVKYTGMVKTLFRPSDDATMFPFLVPANAFLAVELNSLGQMLSALGVYGDIAQEALDLAKEIRQGVLQYGTTVHPKYGRVFAYETDGYGSTLIMDDANGPSLLSLPYLGFIESSDPLYKNTRNMILSPDDNPWYFTGPYINGIGSPHTGFTKVWPMAVIMRGLTSDNRTEVGECLDQLKASTSGLGLMHESVSAFKPTDYTRSWFAWCNSLVSQFVIDAIMRFPGIV
ncbi:hypothetical protein IW140_001906 [Coemansia sp. RSA 1813]|nr:hypothetical protein EV178_005073 [Coemansia sp. RSA 1646]KAJ1769911.1 hypothetical protein LPJ74_003632 [Coemansia sp. RSA 1843]KAJ2087249.1 hypothetical protein IW138_005095 [Coemansia sp. RSA 986]KAJ2212089.1 hypothetical protein EV179_004951 [Coemansia sp. RSA 487]KAJ2570952.1 hypothetical protein IW140_001906 [Coemansia sp. RSA 1813]